MKNKAIIYLLFCMFILIMNWEAQKSVAIAAFHQQVKQEDAIRLRILANSDAVKDQIVKREIRNEVNAVITEWVGELQTLTEASEAIVTNLDEIEEVVAAQLEQENIDQGFSVEFDAVQFPTKLYGNLVYPAGIYDAVLITIGEGNGENWWCVLFPPLCFLDFANGDAIDPEEENEEKEVEVSFFVAELFAKIVDWFDKDTENQA